MLLTVYNELVKIFKLATGALNKKATEIENNISDTSGLVKKNYFDTKLRKIHNKVTF